MRRLLMSLLMAGLGLTGQSHEIELTGLVDLDSCRSACVKIHGRALSFRIGEAGEGITLLSFNARSGWALFLQDTNQIKVWLASHCLSSAPASAWGNLALGAGRLVPKNTIGGKHLPSMVGDLRQHPANDYIPNLPGASRWLGQTPTITQPPPSEGNVASTQAEAATLSPSYSGNPASSDTLVSVPPQDASAASPGPASAADVIGQSAESTSPAEGERIRLFYGDDAYLAWDIAQARRKYQPGP